MINLKETNKNDKLKRNVEHGLDNMKGTTPFDPPSAYEEEKKTTIPFDEMAPLLKDLMEEHKAAAKQTEAFEKALVDFKSNGFKLNQEINAVFGDFFKFFDNNLLLHNEKEEKALFHLLNERLLEAGEHSIGENPNTAIDVMEDDHVRFIQLGALTFNLFGLATRIQDDTARQFVCDTGFNTGRELVELIKLHIFREDYTLFPLAHKLIKPEEFEKLYTIAKKYNPAPPASGCGSH
jgi:hemerythrin-like domain-containing protein